MSTPLITSLQNPHVKAAVKLRDRKGREEQGRILIDGIREITRATQASVEIVELFVCESLGSSATTPVVDLLQARGATSILSVTKSVMEKLAYGDRAEEILAVAKTPSCSLAELSARMRSAPPLLAVVEGVEKPGNLGAILRTADAAGVSGLIVADGGTDLYNPNAIRASLGAIFTVPVCAAKSAQALAFLREQGLQLFAARVTGAEPYTSADFVGPCALVLGSEARGLSPLWEQPDITAISLPMLGTVDSLNLSATAAVLFYEALRQRSRTPQQEKPARV